MKASQRKTCFRLPHVLFGALAAIGMISASFTANRAAAAETPPAAYDLTPEQMAEISHELGDDAQKGLSDSVSDLMRQLALEEYVREVREAEVARLANSEVNPYTETQPPIRIFGLEPGVPHETPEREPTLNEKVHDLDTFEAILKKSWFF